MYMRKPDCNKHMYNYIYPVQVMNFLSMILDPKKHHFTEMQTQILMERFQVSAYPNKEEICQLAMLLNITIKIVENWFSFMRRNEAAKEMLNRS